MSKWYLYENDEVIGPFATPELKERISAASMVCPAGSEDWKKASEIDALATLFQEESAPAPQSPPAAEEEAEQTVEKKQSQEKPEAKVTHKAKRKDGEQPKIKPDLKTLHHISQFAGDEELLREHEEFWDEYDRAEQRILRNEMTSRSIWPEEEETEQESVF